MIQRLIVAVAQVKAGNTSMKPDITKWNLSNHLSAVLIKRNYGNSVWKYNQCFMNFLKMDKIFIDSENSKNSPQRLNIHCLI